MKRLIALLLALCVMVPASLAGMTFTAVAEESSVQSAPTSYIRNGLVSWYDGSQNTRAGKNTNSAVWEDLISGYDFTVTKSDTCYFTEEGFHQKTGKSYFPQEIVDVVNGQEYTIEILLSDFVSIGSDYNTFMNSDNDNFALFRRNSNNVLEFKFGATAGSNRPVAADGLNLLQNALVTITSKFDGQVIIYINGVQVADKPCNLLMGANNLFIGHVTTKDYETTYRSIRFYNRELSPAEVKHNAAVDGYGSVKDIYVTDGLVSLYSGISNTAEGYNPDSTVWADLVSGNDLNMKINEKNYFTREGFHLNSARNYFPQAIVDLVNGNEFTVEMYLGDLESLGESFNTFINSSNDNFSLFRRISNNVIEFKFAGNAGSERPVVSEGLDAFANSVVTVTYKVGGNTTIYVDGVACASKSSPKAMGANDLFLGHDESSRNYDTTFRSVRFYNRELTAQEVAANAKADGVYGTSVEPNNPGYISIAQPKTPIAGDVALICSIDSADELSAVIKAETKPAAAILHINKALEVTTSNGTKIDTLDSVLSRLEYKVLPVFEIKDQNAIEPLTSYLKENRFYDASVLSTDPQIVVKTREIMPQLRGIIDYTEKYKDKTTLTREECIELRKSIHSNMGTVALIPQACARTEVVQYLYDIIVNVWVRANDKMTVTEQYDALLSGAIGVVTDDYQALYNTAAKLPENTLTRVPLNIGHRGIPSGGYPENTLEGAIAAYKAGANVIECDIYLTKDKEIVIMHDGTTDRTCNGSLNVEASTLEALKKLYVNKGFENNSKLNKCQIPTLREFLEYFKDTDCALFIEIKSANPNIVPILKELIEEYDMYAQCGIITFNESQMANMRKYYPEMSVGALCGGYLGDNTTDSDMRSVMNFIGKYNATLNPSYAGYGANSIRSALLRGISIYPWTFDGTSYNNYFLWGYSGLTGNSANTLDKYIKKVTISTGDVTTCTVGDSVPFTVKATTYKNEETDVSGKNSCKLVIIEGSDIASFDGNKLNVTGEGVVTVVAQYTNARTIKYSMLTQPISIVVKAAEQTSETESSTVEETTETIENNTENETETAMEETSGVEINGSETEKTETEAEANQKSGCKSAAGALIAFVSVIGCGLAFVNKRK